MWGPEADKKLNFTDNEKKTTSIKLAQLKDATTKGDLDNRDVVLKKKNMMDWRLRLLKGCQLPRVKDKYGNNIKQHFGLWKYFLDSKTGEKSKFYISNDCRKLTGKEAVAVSE